MANHPRQQRRSPREAPAASLSGRSGAFHLACRRRAFWASLSCPIVASRVSFEGPIRPCSVPLRAPDLHPRCPLLAPFARSSNVYNLLAFGEGDRWVTSPGRLDSGGSWNVTLRGQRQLAARRSVATFDCLCVLVAFVSLANSFAWSSRHKERRGERITTKHQPPNGKSADARSADQPAEAVPPADLGEGHHPRPLPIALKRIPTIKGRPTRGQSTSRPQPRQLPETSFSNARAPTPPRRLRQGTFSRAQLL